MNYTNIFYIKKNYIVDKTIIAGMDFTNGFINIQTMQKMIFVIHAEFLK